MNFHDISWQSQFLIDFPYAEGSETLIFLRENNDLGAGPPKYPLLAKFTENRRISPFLLVLGGNSPKRAKKVISGDFCDFRSGRTPSGPMNLLCFSMVWGASGRPGARRCAFSTFYPKKWKIIKTMKILKIYENSWDFMKIMKLIENLDFCESGGSKTLIFLRNYWCFCNVMNFMKFNFLTGKLKIS